MESDCVRSVTGLNSRCTAFSLGSRPKIGLSLFYLTKDVDSICMFQTCNYTNTNAQLSNKVVEYR